MQIKLSPDDIETIISKADTAARRLRRRLGLPACDREDLGQDLLIDLLRRLPAFDPARGSLGAFAGLILRNQSSRIAIRIMRERRAQGGGLLSLDAPSGQDDQRPLAETIGEDEGLSAWHGQATKAHATTEQHQAVQTAISRLLGLCRPTLDFNDRDPPYVNHSDSQETTERTASESITTSLAFRCSLLTTAMTRATGD